MLAFLSFSFHLTRLMCRDEKSTESSEERFVNPLSFIFVFNYMADKNTSPRHDGEVSLRDPAIMARYGVLFHEYQTRWCFWEAWMLLRRIMLLGVFVLSVSFFDLATAKLALSLAVGSLLVVQFLVRPFKQNINNYLETFGLSLLLLLVAVNSQAVTALQSGVTSIVLLLGGAAALLSPLVLTAVQRVYSVLRERIQSNPIAMSLLRGLKPAAPSNQTAVELREALISPGDVERG
jgi:hypothetical protein